VKRRVVVTGLGLVTSLGTGVEKTWEGVLAGRSGAARLTRFDPTEFRCQIAAEVKDFNPEDWLPKKKIRRLDAFIHFALSAAVQAWEMADLPEPLGQDLSPRAGCILGVGIGGMHTLESSHTVVETRGPSRISPFFVPKMIANMAPGEIAMRYQLWGPNLSISTACAAGAHGVGESFRAIEYGHADIMVCGGAEAVITPTCVAGFASARALSTRNDEPEKASRPFEKDRDGFVIAEGAGVLILEELEFARARGANILAEIKGYGLTCDAYHMTAPEPNSRGFIMCMNQAIADAGLAPQDIQYINAHGTSTDLNDLLETKGIRAVFGDHADKLGVSSTKSQLGHMLGATGGVEAVMCVLTLRDQVMPPTINYDTPDPECDLDYVPNVKRPAEIQAILSNSFGFGGTNASLVFSRFE